jgi:hypothetical protein
MRFAKRSLYVLFLMLAILGLGVFLPVVAHAQGTLADYQRAQELGNKFRGLVVNVPGSPTWIAGTNHFWYSKSVKGGTEFVMVDADEATKKPAFDHEKLAAAINLASGGKYTALTLPFAPSAGGRGGGGGGGRGAGGAAPGGLTFVDNEQSIEFGAAGFMYKCTLIDYKCTKGAAIQQPATGGRGGRGGAPADDSLATDDDSLAAPMEVGGDPVDGLEYLAPALQQGGGQGRGAGQVQERCRPRPQAGAQGQGRGGAGGRGAAAPAAAGQAPTEPQVCGSFDGKWDAFIQNFNVFLRPLNPSGPAIPLSFDGSEGNYYTLDSIAWSPDSKKLVAYHTRPGYDRRIHYVESSPTDQLQPKTRTSNLYRKPGDALDIACPALFDVATKKETEIDPALFPNAFSLSRPAWWKDGRAFTFEYNQRGHQVYRIIEVDAQTGKERALISEESKTFIYYNNVGAGLSGGRKYRRDINDGKEIIWASERDGWEHLYLLDGVTGQVKNQITKGEWVVRNVDSVDEAGRQIWFEAGGMNPGQDPYFTHYYRINFDGTGLTKLTEADGNHSVTFWPNWPAAPKYYIDTWQRVDLPPVAQLRRAEDQKVILDLEKGDASALLAAGFKMPEVFVAKGRDGKTDIWGVIFQPTNFDPAKKYPVVESIYAGPQGSFAPKTWNGNGQSIAELGFIWVQMDGMGTGNRSKAFHDVAFKNLGDAGFPDRILWHKAVAAKYPWYDITRVGIYGTSAGGQNAMGAMLFHPEFYKVAVTNSGCHDNRMDKIWWNEQWMGWPLGPEYVASSNMENASKLQGKVLLIVPELDTNVDPSSTFQVVNALLKANKQFDMLVVPGSDHGAGGISSHFRDDFFVRHLLHVEPPNWNQLPPTSPERGPGN